MLQFGKQLENRFLNQNKTHLMAIFQRYWLTHLDKAIWWRRDADEAHLPEGLKYTLIGGGTLQLKLCVEYLTSSIIIPSVLRNACDV